MALRARVSAGTVSNVLTGRRGVAPGVAARVRRAVGELGYVAHAAASQLRSRRTAFVGVIVPELASPFFAAFVSEVESLARGDGYRTLVASSGEDPAEEAAQLKALAAWDPAGILMVPCDDRFRSRRVLEGRGVPLVAVDRVTEATPVDAVGVDNEGAARQAAAHLVALGHERLLVVASRLKLAIVRERVAGVRAAAGLRAVEVIEGGPRLPEVAEAVDRRLGRARLPSAILALTSTATLGTLLAVARRNLAVPDDVSLVGFDDYEWMQAYRPAISAVRQPVVELARTAWSRLRARQGGDAAPPTFSRLGCSLEWRQSTAVPFSGSTPHPAGRPRARASS